MESSEPYENSDPGVAGASTGSGGGGGDGSGGGEESHKAVPVAVPSSPAATPGSVPCTHGRQFHSVSVPWNDRDGNQFQEKFTVDVRYENLQYVGGGAYGIVARADDVVKSQEVAIKKVGDVFSNRSLNDSKRILRELILLRSLGGHPNVTWIKDVMVWPNQRNFRDMYIVSDLMEGDLGGVIESNQTLTDAQMKYFLYQMLKALKYIHSASVLHRDLKPQNVLVNSDCSIKVTDFGLGRAVEESLEQEKTPYVVTRWYRAPELLVDFRTYGPSVDMWSVGCILAELLWRKPLFRGRNFADQLKQIITVLGTPTPDDVSFITNKELLKLLASWKPREKLPFKKLFKRANPLAVDLLEKLLVFDPRKRMNVDAALAHPYVAEFRAVETELEARVKVVMDFEGKGRLSKQELQVLMLREASYFHPAYNDTLRMSGSGGLTGSRDWLAKHRGTNGVAAGATTAAAGGGGAGGGAGAASSEPSGSSGVGAAGGVASGVGAETVASAAGGGAAADGVSAGGTGPVETASGITLSDTAVQEMQAEEDRRQRSVDSQRARAQAGLAALEGESAAASAAGAGASEAVLRDVRALVTQAIAVHVTAASNVLRAEFENRLRELEANLTARLQHVEDMVEPLKRRQMALERQLEQSHSGASGAGGGIAEPVSPSQLPSSSPVHDSGGSSQSHYSHSFAHPGSRAPPPPPVTVAGGEAAQPLVTSAREVTRRHHRRSGSSTGGGSRGSAGSSVGSRGLGYATVAGTPTHRTLQSRRSIGSGGSSPGSSYNSSGTPRNHYGASATSYGDDAAPPPPQLGSPRFAYRPGSRSSREASQ